MKKWLVIFLCVLGILFFFINQFLLANIGEKNNSKSENLEMHNETELVQKQNKSHSSQEVVEGFLNTVYEYDTNERAFYEGAAQYMTVEAYEKLVPMPSEAEPEEMFHMQSRLDYYDLYQKIMKKETIYLAEVWYYVSGSGDYRIHDIVKITLNQQNGWIITDCVVIDSQEE